MIVGGNINPLLAILLEHMANKKQGGFVPNGTLFPM
jgi:hypothetical protein